MDSFANILVKNRDKRMVNLYILYAFFLKYYSRFESHGGKHPNTFQNMAVLYSELKNTEKEIEYHRKVYKKAASTM